MIVCPPVTEHELRATAESRKQKSAVKVSVRHCLTYAGATYQIITSLETLEHLHHVPQREYSIKRISLYP